MLKPRAEAIAICVAGGMTDVDAAAACGVNSKTVQRARNNSVVQARIEELQAECTDQSIRRRLASESHHVQSRSKFSLYKPTGRNWRIRFASNGITVTMGTGTENYDEARAKLSDMVNSGDLDWETCPIIRPLCPRCNSLNINGFTLYRRVCTDCGAHFLHVGDFGQMTMVADDHDTVVMIVAGSGEFSARFFDPLADKSVNIGLGTLVQRTAYQLAQELDGIIQNNDDKGLAAFKSRLKSSRSQNRREIRRSISLLATQRSLASLKE